MRFFFNNHSGQILFVRISFNLGFFMNGLLQNCLNILFFLYLQIASYNRLKLFLFSILDLTKTPYFTS